MNTLFASFSSVASSLNASVAYARSNEVRSAPRPEPLSDSDNAAITQDALIVQEDVVTLSDAATESSQSETRANLTSQELTTEEEQEVQELKERDREVRMHEQAHAAVGGQYAGAPQYEYEKGPDGNQYAVGGEVSIDVSEENNPQDTIDKMQIVRAAALAPAEPSAQDLKVAAEASQKEMKAKAELRSSEQSTSSSLNTHKINAFMQGQRGELLPRVNTYA